MELFKKYSLRLIISFIFAGIFALIFNLDFNDEFIVMLSVITFTALCIGEI